LEKILRLVNQLNGGPVSQPTFFPEGSEPLRGDTQNVLLKKICGALYNLSTAGGTAGIWGSDGDNEVRRGADVYVLDYTTGLYHRQLAESTGVDDPIEYLEETGYAFAAIPT
jgi:hypothetical protein